MDDSFFRLILFLILSALGIIRAYYEILGLITGKNISFRENPFKISFLAFGGLAAIVLTLLYTISPRVFATRLIELPTWLRWAGAITGVISVALFFWVHYSLGKNFSSMLHTRDDHKLITSGPYRWVRHPMYTVFYLIATSFFLLSANWYIGLIWFGGFTFVIVTRIESEERVMIEKFGEEYREYMKRTGKFLPKILPPL